MKKKKERKVTLKFWQYPHLALSIQIPTGMRIGPFCLRTRFHLMNSKVEGRAVSIIYKQLRG